MRIKCTSKPKSGPAGGYIIGREHRVIELDIGVSEISFRVEDPDGYSPYLVNPIFFEITSRLLPSRWIVNTYDRPGVFTLTPSSWACDGFWDAYFDGEAWAERLYEQEISSMKLEDPLPNDQLHPEEIILYVLDKLESNFSQDTTKIIRELIDHKEAGVALETLCTQISEQHIVFPHDLKSRLIDAAHLMYIPISQLDWP